MRICLALLFALVLSSHAIAQENYAANPIPQELLPYASAVIRNNNVNVEVKSLDNTLYHVKMAITVLNKNGADIARIAIWHNKSNIIKGIKGAIYNEFGKITGKFSESDFEDDNAGNSTSLFEDSEIKHYEPVVNEYPYTIVYEYEMRSKQSLNFDDWEPNSTIGAAVEKSTYTFTCESDFNIRYKEINMPVKAVITTNKQGNKTYTWQVSNLKAIREEPFSPNPDKYLSFVKIAPEKFSYEGIKGSFTNWNELGKWQYNKLLANRQQLLPATTALMKQLTNSIADPKQKAKRAYEYMQNKVHYISVQIGIGGYQPFLAADVDRQNYGDCKALVNYTQALLKAINIDSYYCVVQAGNRKVSMIDDFASMDQGNHIILCIPFKNDTTFLECTSQTIPFGFLGDFTDDRTVLACTPTGGKLMHTPKYTDDINTQYRKAELIIGDGGGLSGDITTTFGGTRYNDRDMIINEAPEDQKKDLQKTYAINNLNIEDVSLKQIKSEQPVTTESLKISATDYALANDGKLYFVENTANRLNTVPYQVRNRQNDVYINRGYIDQDEINYTIPNGYHVDMRPAGVLIEKPFGRFESTSTVNGNRLIYKRVLQLKGGTYSKDTYQDIIDFFQKIVEADNSNITLAKGN